eukprot:gene12151-biopygen248
MFLSALTFTVCPTFSVRLTFPVRPALPVPLFPFVEFPRRSRPARPFVWLEICVRICYVYAHQLFYDMPHGKCVGEPATWGWCRWTTWAATA